MFPGLIVAALLTLPAPARSAEPAPEVPASMCPADPALGRLVAASDLVVIGRLPAPSQGRPTALRDYVDLPVEGIDTLKGAAAGSLAVRVFSGDRPYMPSNAALAETAGTPVLMFLTRVDEAPAGYYFAGYTPSALRAASPAEVAGTAAEIARQDTVIGQWRRDETLPHYTEVKALVDRLGSVRGAQQQAVFDRIEALGEEAVPAIVALMDDRRRLADQRMTLVNHATDAFEGMRHYGPEEVVDALAAILNQITGQSFGAIMNGGSEAERTGAVAGWRVYAADLACPKP
ncbi:MAG: hypothetical protein EBR82_21755 [Caulobacteraceae bacterium]|nr:hypothetical protein [Caulobacteraceae bacterium]